MNTKGFATILVAISIFGAAIFLSVSQTSFAEPDFSQTSFTETKLAITNYIVTLNRYAQDDCDWDGDVQTCLNETSDEILTILENSYGLTCNSPNFAVAGNNATGTLECSKTIVIGGELIFNNIFRENMVVNKLA
jgi:hypothetical protein